MYPISEYLNQGISLAKHCLLGKSVLPTLMLYTTNACNSRCRTCRIWEIQKHQHLPLESIQKLLRSPLVKKSTISLEGGEFLLHPDYENILELLSKRGRFILLSNGLMTERLVGAVERFNIPEVLISLDGGPETYLRARGVNGYSKVCESILSLRGRTRASVIFTFSPWNDINDFFYVKNFCKQNNINLKINIYCDIPLFDVREAESPINGVEDANISFPEKDYLRLYNKWLKKETILPCFNIRFRAVVWPDGSVPLCQGKEVMLGNIHEQTIDQIWSCEKTKSLWKEYVRCNDCWITFHKIYDVALVKIMEKLLPRPVIKKLLGEYALD